MTMKPKKQQTRRPPSTAYHQRPVEETTAGRRYRVRDKDWEALWGENLSYEDACKLKEQVVTRGKSRTARVEDMEIQHPDGYQSEDVGQDDGWPLSTATVATGKPPVLKTSSAAAVPLIAKAPDPQLEALREKAKRTSKAAAEIAQQRHQRAAAKDRSAGAVAPTSTPRPIPVVRTEVEEDEEISEDDTMDLHDLMADAGSDQPSELDLARAREAAQRDQDQIGKRARDLYLEQAQEGHVAWEQLSRQAQAHWRFEALAQQDRERREAAVVTPDDDGAVAG